MKTFIKMQGTLVTLKSFDYHLPVYPGMLILLHQKYYTVQQAIFDAETEAFTVLVARSTTGPT